MKPPRLVFSDFDGTLTQKGSIQKELFSIFELLQKKQIPIIIVTGRSYSWGQFLKSHFPFEAIIAEGGGVIIREDLKYEVMVEDTVIEELKMFERDFLEVFPELEAWWNECKYLAN